MKSTRMVTLVAVVLLLAACSGDGGAASTTQAADAPTTTSASSSSGEISIANFQFDGPESVQVGATVTVTNSDDVSHTWTSEDDAFDSGSLSQGETFEFTFDEAGEYQFVCSIHPGMSGSITVEG